MTIEHTTKGAVFKDIGFSPEKAAELEMKFYFLEAIRKFIERQEMTQAQAAEFFGVQQPKISKIKTGDATGMSLEYLVRLISKTGGKFSYSFRQPRKGSVRLAA